MFRPGLQRSGLFLLPSVSLIDTDNPTSRAGNVIQQGLSHFETDAETLQAGGHGAP